MIGLLVCGGADDADVELLPGGETLCHHCFSSIQVEQREGIYPKVEAPPARAGRVVLGVRPDAQPQPPRETRSV